MTQALVINCSAGYTCGGVLFMTGAESRLVDCHIRGCHTMDAWADGLTGGLLLFNSGSLTMIGGTITGCHASGQGGGACVAGHGTLSLINVLVADCHSNAKSGGGGGIVVFGGDATLIMSGGAIRDCHALNGGSGGGLNVEGEVHLSGVTVQGCTASSGNGGGLQFSGAQAQLNEVAVQDCAANFGGGMSIDTGDVTLVDVSFEDCQAGFQGGAIFGGSMLHANRVRLARCNSFGRMESGGIGNTGGAVTLSGSSTWVDSIISDCASPFAVVNLNGGTHTFTRMAILRCHATMGEGGGLRVSSGTTMLLDSRIADSSSVDRGGCVYASAKHRHTGQYQRNPGALVLRNTTLSNCSAPEGPYVFVETEKFAFTSEMLTLEPPCDEEHSGALIAVVGTAPLQARDMKVHACASSRQPILSNGTRLLRCSDGEDVCGAAATCTDVVPLLSAPNLTTIDCSCTGESFPSLAAASAALAPYGIDPSVDYCVTARVAIEADLGGFVLERVVRLSKTSSANAAHTLDLTIRIGGTDVYPAAWTIEASSVPFWLSLPLQGDIGATEQTGNFLLTANTSELPEHLSTPYEALLNLSVSSQRDKMFLVLVKLYVSAPALARTSIWGRPTSERVCHRDTQGTTHTEVVLGEVTNMPFTACDVDGLAIEHDNIGSFEALLIDQSSGTLHSLSIASDLPGTYLIAVQVPHLGEFGLRLTFTAADGTTEQVGVERVVRTICPAAKDVLPNGLDCGCQRGTSFNENEAVCELCPRGTSSVAGGSDCGVCAEGFYSPLDSSTFDLSCEPCLNGATCPWGVTLRGVQTKPNYWRLTPESDDVLECLTDYDNQVDNQDTPCLGGSGAACLPGHTGPKCRVCVEELHYVGDGNVCTKCPSGTVPALVGGAVLVITITLLYLVALLLNCPPESLKTASQRLRRLIAAVQSLGPAKLKAALTFFQIVMSLPVSFDLAPLDIEFVKVLNVFAWLEFDWSEAVYPTGCIVGGFFNRLILVALAPFLLILAVPMVLCILSLLTSLCARKSASGGKMSIGQVLGFAGVLDQPSDPDGKEHVSTPPFSLNRRESAKTVVAEQLGKWQQRLLGTLPLVLLVVFVMLPAVSRSIFSAWDCVAYKSGPDSEVRYLRRELSVVCGNEEHDRITALAWMLVIIWPIGMQLLFFFALWFNRKAMAAGTNNAYTRAMRFLTGGYKNQYFYWEVVELFRRLACSGFIMLIPHEYIFMRIAIAIAVSTPILVMTAFLQPVKNLEDTVLGITGQMIMLVAFCCCIVIRIVNSRDLDDAAKNALLGFTSPQGFFFSLGLCFVVFFIAILGSYAYRVTLILKKGSDQQGGVEAESSAAWMVGSASSAAVAALLLGSAAYGMAGGIVGASIFFVIGGAVGAVLQARWKGVVDRCCWTKDKVDEQTTKLADLELTTGCAPAS